MVSRARRSGAVKLGALALTGILVGCATEVPMRPRGVVVGNQGGSWEVVMAAPAVAAELETGTEYARLDAGLNIVSDDPIVGAGAWPEPQRQSLDQVRRLFLPRRAEEQLYFSEYPYYYGPRLYAPWYSGPTIIRYGR
jgi:hypothetical protein